MTWTCAFGGAFIFALGIAAGFWFSREWQYERAVADLNRKGWTFKRETAEDAARRVA